jgi:ribosomal-protein-alanine N-acetyltransferase
VTLEGTAARPVLQTERVDLRPFSAADAAFIVALVNDPQWLRFIGDRKVTDEAGARAWIESRLVAPCRTQGFGLWAMQRRADGELLGMCGLVQRDGLPEIDLGYALLPRHRGQGYVREAGAACLAHAAEALGKRRVLAITDPDNERSIRVLESLGMVRDDSVLYESEGRRSAVFAWQAPGVAVTPAPRP